MQQAELALYCNPVFADEFRVQWHSYNPAADFLVTRQLGTVEQYCHWLDNGTFSAILFDASILQVSYDIRAGEIIGHRLAYIPCPFMVDDALLREGEPVADVVALYDSLSDIRLRSPIRFDFDRAAAAPRHPASHLTLNSSDCRIACVAPIHVHRFVDFVFRNFYPTFWGAHIGFFGPAAWRHAGEKVISDDDLRTVHLMWDVNATASGRI
jgi:hypothetical protein